MKNKLTILGCGYLGTALAKKAIAKGWRVDAFTRNEKTAENLLSLGVDNIQTGRLEEEGWHSKMETNRDFVVVCVGASSPDLDGYRRSYLEGMQSVKKWLGEEVGPSVLFTSSTSVYPQSGGEVVEENAIHEGLSERGKILLGAERECLSLNSDSRRAFILRLAGLYGPGRHLLVDKILRGEEMSGSPDRILNLIHRDDAVRAIFSVHESASCLKSQVFNVSDNQWATRGEIVNWLSAALKRPSPKFEESDPPGFPNRKVSNQKLRQETAWEPKYPSFEEGYQEMLASA